MGYTDLMVAVRSPRALEFACHSAACAPPPAGSGGSSGGGGRRTGDGTYVRRSKTDSTQIQASDLKRGDKVVFAQQVKTVSSVGMQRNGKVGVSFTTGGVTDLRPDQVLPRPARKVPEFGDP